MAGAIRFSPLPNPANLVGYSHVSRRNSGFPVTPLPSPSSPTCNRSLSLSLLQARSSTPSQTLHPADLYVAGGDGGGGGAKDDNNGGSGGNGGWSSGGGSESDDRLPGASDLGFLGFFLSGWRSRVAADPQFPFKVLMEEIVGVGSCVLGDMASRPNFGLNELDFVFSTLVVGAILNFVLMYLLAPTAASSSLSSNLPGIFSSCPASHMFEAGGYTLLDRIGTFVYKGTVFAAVGFSAGLAGTALSNGLINLRKKMDPEFESPNKPPPTLLNALTWAIHMGLSSNLRYQTLNGVEFLMARSLSPTGLGFKASVVVLRCLNNVLGGVTFVQLARLTGSQKAAAHEVEEGDEVKEKLIGDGAAVSETGDGDLQSSESHSLGTGK